MVLEAPLKISCINLGCRVNRAEMDVIAAAFERSGCQVTDEERVDAVVINSCVVTAEAESKTRAHIRRASKRPGAPLVVLTGCAATLIGERLKDLTPRMLIALDKRTLVAQTLQELRETPCGKPADAPREAPCEMTHDALCAAPVKAADEIPADAELGFLGGRTRPNIKIQDGCDHTCSFCVVRFARGLPRSESPDDILEALESYVAKGAKEVVLCGINVGSYSGIDDKGKTLRLPELLCRLLQNSSIGRLRLSSIEPEDVDTNLCKVMEGSGGRIAPYLHICLQSGSDTILQRMRRNYTTADFEQVCDTVRMYLPHCAIETDLMCGFPGETDDDFARSLDFCEKMAFSKMHVFSFSPREGTIAANMGGQVDAAMKKARTRQARRLSDVLRERFAQQLIGTTDSVLLQGSKTGISGGLFEVEFEEMQVPGELISAKIHGVKNRWVLAAQPTL